MQWLAFVSMTGITKYRDVQLLRFLVEILVYISVHPHHVDAHSTCLHGSLLPIHHFVPISRITDRLACCYNNCFSPETRYVLILSLSAFQSLSQSQVQFICLAFVGHFGCLTILDTGSLAAQTHLYSIHFCSRCTLSPVSVK